MSIKFPLHCNGVRYQICWFEISQTEEYLLILLTGWNIFLVGNIVFKDLIIAHLHSSMEDFNWLCLYWHLVSIV